MVPIVEWEGYSDATYKDTKGIDTTGVGQTGRYATMPFPEVFYIKKQELVSYTPRLHELPDKVQDALLVANYRGDWAGSPKTRALFDQGMYTQAAQEFLDNDDYREAKKEGTGVAERFEWVADAIRSMA